MAAETHITLWTPYFLALPKNIPHLKITKGELSVRISVIKSRKMRRAEHVARVREKVKEKRHLARPRRRW
jgi:hypothetical protein